LIGLILGYGRALPLTKKEADGRLQAEVTKQRYTHAQQKPDKTLNVRHRNPCLAFVFGFIQIN